MLSEPVRERGDEQINCFSCFVQTDGVGDSCSVCFGARGE